MQHLRERKTQRIHRWNNDEDSSARNNWNAEAKENQQLDYCGPDKSQSIRQAPINLLKSLYAGVAIESEARPADGQPKREAVIDRDWVNHHVCRPSYYIYVVPNI